MPGLGGTTNNYEILAQLASGGMAEIFLARVTAMAGVERHVVLKRILPAFRNDPQMVAMFLDEARLHAQLHHPNIAQLHDVGLLGGSYFYTMEYVHGETVQSLMHRAVSKREPIPLQHILTIAAGVTAALYHAHTRVGPDRKSLEIIHRDVSPANIMITFDGAVKLIDFGVAKMTGRMTQTRAGVVKGKVAYLSPEQIGEKGLDGRSDLFSLAICLYEMLTLHGLFVRQTDLMTLAAIVQEMPPPPSQFRRDTPPQIDQLVMTALAKDPSSRFGNADQMHQAIEAAAASAKLSMSPSSLGRYLGQMFGHRVEPWLANPGDAPVSVAAQLVEPTEIHVEPLRDVDIKQAREVDQRISAVRKVPQLDEALASLASTGKQPAVPHIPSATEHPQWEATVSRTPMPELMRKLLDVPNDFELDSAETSIAQPRYHTPPPQRQHRPSQAPAPTQLGPKPVPPSNPHTMQPAIPASGPRDPQPQSAPLMQSGGHAPLMQSGGHAPLMQSGGNPALRPSLPALPNPANPVGQRPLPASGPRAQQNWDPQTYRTRPPQKPTKDAGSYNVPRILLVVAFLVAIAAAVVIAII